MDKPPKAKATNSHHSWSLYVGRTNPEQAKATEKGIFPPGMTGNFQKQLIGFKKGTKAGMIPARNEREDASGEDKIIIKNVSPRSLSPQVHVAA